MFDIGPEKILVVLVIALVFLGPERLPDMARQIGSAYRQLRGVQDTIHTEIRSALDPASEPTPPQPSTELPEGRTFT